MNTPAAPSMLELASCELRPPSEAAASGFAAASAVAPSATAPSASMPPSPGPASGGPASGATQARIPSHVAGGVQSPSGSVPAGFGEHVPGVPAWLQDSHWPSQRLSQQTPSAQNPL